MNSRNQYPQRDLKEEREFLSAYHADDFEQVSVATDIVVFSMMGIQSPEARRSPVPGLKVLLIRRGEHPFKNCWALPGGFLRKNETVEACAFREVYEETNVVPRALLPVGVFSNPQRDPRTRVVSNAFVSVVDADACNARGGDDAQDAAWFDVFFNREQGGKVTVNLSDGEDAFTCVLEERVDSFRNITYEIVEEGGLAFDHGIILASAFRTLRNQKDEYELVFRFLPDRFTLSSMQKVYEIINNTFDQPANFRRKVMPYVAETEEYETCVGHRPAKLYERKQ